MRSGKRRGIWLAATLLGVAYFALRAIAGKLSQPVVGERTVTANCLERQAAPNWARRWAFAVGIVVAAILACGILAYAKNSNTNAAVALAMTGGDPSRAPILMRRYGCAGCHAIPGIPGADGKVAPNLAGLRERVFIGGVLRNTPDDLRRWIVHPETFSTHTAMPTTGISEDEARDVAAYLYAH